MDTLTFLNSPLLWGLSLAAIPLIIHLLYRRQYRRVDWAPMRYLKMSIQRNRRRIRIEQLLLLLLRTALVLLLFFLV
ncbi:MAG: BatA domain-containing protein, partial [Pirellulales bacterium]